MAGWNKVEKTYSVWVFFGRTVDTYSITHTLKDARIDAYDYLMSVKKGRVEIVEGIGGSTVGLATLSPKHDKIVWYDKKNGRRGRRTARGNVIYA